MIREKGSNKYIVYMGLLALLLASTHSAVYPICFILFLPILVSDLIYKISKGKQLDGALVFEKYKNTKKILIALLVCVICGFFSPGLNTYLYTVLIMLGNSTSFITEHFPTSVQNNPFILLNIAIIIGVLLTKKIKINIRDFFTIGGFFVLAMLSIRSYSLYLILTVFAFGRIFSLIEKNYLKHITFTDSFNHHIVKIILLLVILPSAIANVISESKIGYIDNSVEPIYPVEMVKYIKENMDYENMRIYNFYDYGAYLLFNDIKVFIDSRSDLYMKEFNKGVTVFDDTMGMPANHKMFFEKYDFTHLLIPKESKSNVVIELLPEFKVIKEDEYFLLYEKVKSEN
jgi:hypothetical protein